jgi:glycosyltransferase involved in cell wall biosynthesis
MEASHDTVWNNIEVHAYKPGRATTPNIHPWVGDFETKVIRAEACINKVRLLSKSGYIPDIILAHHGWGEPMFVKELWPQAKLAIYCEFFYRTQGADTNYDPEFQPDDRLLANCRLHLKNINNLMHFQFADAAVCPTHWQASTFPKEFRSKIQVIHDGIDTEILAPNSDISLSLETKFGPLKIDQDDEVITFVARNLEPMRGFHKFMRALPKILKDRPNARVIIVGGEDTGYGPAPDARHGDASWKKIFTSEIESQMSAACWKRIHFVGRVPYENFIKILQISSCHIYLTYPFVLSWSLLEAMSIGCSIVASDTAPLREAIRHEETGILVNFFDTDVLTEACIRILRDRKLASRLGANARKFAVEKYDLHEVCLPKQLEWLSGLIT